MKRILAVVLALTPFANRAASQDAPSPTESSVASRVERFTLANGLRVVLEPVPGRRFAALTLSYRVGARDVPRGWTGLAHLSEHAMFAGTEAFDDAEVFGIFDASGSVETNGITGPDDTVYLEVLPGGSLEWAFFVESQRMARIVAGLTEERVERHREIVTSEGWESGKYGWRGLLSRTIALGIFGEGHPYASIHEDRIDVDAIRVRHVRWFLQQHYRPDNAVLAVVGGFDPEEVRASIEHYFGPVVRPSTPLPPRIQVPPVTPLTEDRRIEMSVPDSRDTLVVAWRTPAHRDVHDAELDVISRLIAARIEATLLARGLVFSWSVTQQSMGLGSVFRIEIVPMPGHEPEEVLIALDALLDDMHRTPPDPNSIRGIRERLAAAWDGNVEDLLLRARILGHAEPERPYSLEEEAERYRSVTVESTRDAWSAWLESRGRVVVIARSAPGSFEYGTVRSNRLVERAVTR